MKARASGYSLIEMVVIILVVGIISLVAAEKMRDLRYERSVFAANELMTSLRYIRNVSLDTERTTRVTFDPASSAYSVHIADSAAGGYVSLKNPADQSDWSVTIPQRFSGVAFSSVSINGGNELFFSGTNGVPLGMAQHELSSAGSLVFNTGLTLTIAPRTGYIELTN